MPVPRNVVYRALALLRELGVAYGSTRAMEIWENMADIIDDGDLKMEVFKVMLSGGFTGTHVEIRDWNGVAKVTAIKCLRKWCDVGLREAKEAVEAGRDKTKSAWEIRTTHDENDELITVPFNKLVKELEEAGLTVELI